MQKKNRKHAYACKKEQKARLRHCSEKQNVSSETKRNKCDDSVERMKEYHRHGRHGFNFGVEKNFYSTIYN